ncbi:putative cytochrome b6-f complex subunit 6 [Lupinus albus]|uniref:Cytochrome b6-f complex subunit 6 n=1 Tax=Lupinus albus TaxID=3870 RepID=A0A6A4Q9N4_LUPAL|nr:putative cytochrome b6-f complex subunit 6 [Lupinus albus]
MYKKKISFSFFMPTITSYFGFLLAALTITSALFIGLNIPQFLIVSISNFLVVGIHGQYRLD